MKSILLFLVSFSIFAAEEVKIDKTKEEVKDKKERTFVIVPGPSYDPQIKAGLTLMAMKLFKTDKNDKVSPPSTLVAFGKATTNESWMFGLFSQLYFKEDTWRVKIGGFKGNFMGETLILEIDQFIENTSDVKAYLINVQRRVYKNVYVGIGLTDSEIHFKSAAGFDNKTNNTGVNLEANVDTKNNRFSATDGGLGALKLNIFRESMGNPYDFETMAISYRKFLTLNKNINRVVALMFDSRFAFGGDNSNFNYNYGRGGSQRGYTGTVYEGKNMIRFEGEYRHYFEKILKGRFGSHAFGGLGTVYGGTSKVGNPLASNISDAPMLPHVGLGVRYRIIPEQNLMTRLDFGYGREKEFTMYFSIQEAI